MIKNIIFDIGRVLVSVKWYELMSELAFENFPGMPKEGDSFVYLNLRITILSMKRSRIYRLRVEKLPEEGADEEGGSV